MNGTDIFMTDGSSILDAYSTSNGQPQADSSQESGDWTLVSNTVSSGTRTIVATRANDTGNSNDYTFSASAGSLTVIWAIGATSQYSSGHSNRNATTLSVSLGISENNLLRNFAMPHPEGYRKALRLMEQAEKEKRIGDVPYDPTVDVETWWDLGIGDSTSIWFAQRIGNEIRLIDYYESSGEALSHYANVLEEKGYRYGRHVGPHDITTRELGTGKSRLEVAYELGLDFEVCPRLAVDHGIEAVRNNLDNCWFDKNKCKYGIDCLRQYRKQFDDRMQTFKNKPLHNWASHGADAFRYGCAIDPDTTSQWQTEINVDTRYIV